MTREHLLIGAFVDVAIYVDLEDADRDLDDEAVRYMVSTILTARGLEHSMDPDATVWREYEDDDE